MNVKRASKAIVALILALSVITASFIVAFAAEPTLGQVDEEDPLEASASYVIYRDGDLTLAINVATRVIDFRGSDTSEVVQNTIDQLNGTGRIHIREGAYPISAPIWITCNVSGSGNGTIIKSASDGIKGSMIVVGWPSRYGADRPLYNVTVSGLQIDGSGEDYPNAGYGGLSTALLNHGMLSNLYIHNIPKSHGISLQGTYNTTVTRCYIENIGFGDQYASGIAMGSEYQRIGLTSSYNLIDGVVIKGASMAGIDIEPGHNNTIRNVGISGLTSWIGGGAWGISIFNVPGMSVSSDNVIENVSIHDPPNTGIYAQGISRLTLKSVSIFGAQSVGIYASNADRLRIVDCTIRTLGTSGIFLLESKNMTVRGCLIGNLLDAAAGRGIIMTSDDPSAPSISNLVLGNVITNMEYAVLFNGSSTDFCALIDNVALGCIYGFLLLGSNNIDENNIIISPTE